MPEDLKRPEKWKVAQKWQSKQINRRGRLEQAMEKAREFLDSSVSLVGSSLSEDKATDELVLKTALSIMFAPLDIEKDGDPRQYFHMDMPFVWKPDKKRDR